MEGTSVFPLGIFSIKSFILSSKRPQCQGRWFACVSMQLRAWLKQKKEVDTVWSWCCRLGDEDAFTQRWKYTGSVIAVCLYSCSLWYLLVSQKPSPIPHIFQVHSSSIKKGTLNLILTFWYLEYSLLHIIQLKQF